jgi:hypothetical protein
MRKSLILARIYALFLIVWEARVRKTFGLEIEFKKSRKKLFLLQKLKNLVAGVRKLESTIVDEFSHVFATRLKSRRLTVSAEFFEKSSTLSKRESTREKSFPRTPIRVKNRRTFLRKLIDFDDEKTDKMILMGCGEKSSMFKKLFRHR